MKNRALFSLKDKSKKLKCRLLQFLFGVLRVKTMAVVPLLLFLIILKQRKVKTVRRALYALVIEDKKICLCFAEDFIFNKSFKF